jgi:hypothetical protein
MKVGLEKKDRKRKRGGCPAVRRAVAPGVVTAAVVRTDKPPFDRR